MIGDVPFPALTITDFLRRRLDEEVRAAWQNVFPRHGGVWHSVQGKVMVGQDIQIAEATLYPVAEHIASWNPVRVLSEVNVKRALLVEHRQEIEDTSCQICGGADSEEKRCAPPGWRWSCATCTSTQDHLPCLTLRILAQPYSDHPEFDPTWRI